MDIMSIIEKALNIRTSVHKVISGNLANVETPGYKEKNVDFKKEIDRAMRFNSESSLSDVEVTENVMNDGLASIDGNTVNMENEMVKLTENQLMYHSLVQIAVKRFSMMKFLISEGRR